MEFIWITDKTRTTGSNGHGFIRAQELHWPGNDEDSGSDGLSHSDQGLPVFRVWVECFQHGGITQQWVIWMLRSV